MSLETDSKSSRTASANERANLSARSVTTSGGYATSTRTTRTQRCFQMTTITALSVGRTQPCWWIWIGTVTTTNDCSLTFTGTGKCKECDLPFKPAIGQELRLQNTNAEGVFCSSCCPIHRVENPSTDSEEVGW